MSYQIDKNLASSTLASGYTAGDTTLTLQAGDGAKFSASGDFVVALGTVPNFLLLCTSRSGDVLTVGSSGAEGTSAVNEAIGCVVTQVITSATLVALLAAAGGGLLPWNPTASPPPTLSNWTQINPTSAASFADATNGVTILQSNNASKLSALMIAAPGVAFTLTTKCLAVSRGQQYQLLHPLVVSDGTKYEVASLLYYSNSNTINQLEVGKYATFSSSISDYSGFPIPLWSNGMDLWWQLQYTGGGGNLVYSYSPTGSSGTFVVIETHSATAYLASAPSTIGFGLDNNQNSTAALIELVYWAVTTP